jgi:hypothetical protein
MTALQQLPLACCHLQVSAYGYDALEQQHQQLQADAARVEELNAEVSWSAGNAGALCLGPMLGCSWREVSICVLNQQMLAHCYASLLHL